MLGTPISKTRCHCGKPLIFHLLPGFFFAKEMLLMNKTFWDVDMSAVTAIVIAVSPLNALIGNQISRLGLNGIGASVLGVKISQSEEFDSFDCFAMRKNCAQVIIVFYLHIRSPLSLVNMNENCYRVRRTKRKFLQL